MHRALWDKSDRMDSWLRTDTIMGRTPEGLSTFVIKTASEDLKFLSMLASDRLIALMSMVDAFRRQTDCVAYNQTRRQFDHRPNKIWKIY